jgi:hypothetical protein
VTDEVPSTVLPEEEMDENSIFDENPQVISFTHTDDGRVWVFVNADSVGRIFELIRDDRYVEAKDLVADLISRYASG